ncbi:hypothetical protein [Candidatus Poriferisodalis sp.]|uniref:hypothetical protein n=1 Tax=Candidatus Poriferisodalis sp. TaxID=3101277 RepID=UPI003B012D3B
MFSHSPDSLHDKRHSNSKRWSAVAGAMFLTLSMVWGSPAVSAQEGVSVEDVGEEDAQQEGADDSEETAGADQEGGESAQEESEEGAVSEDDADDSEETTEETETTETDEETTETETTEETTETETSVTTVQSDCTEDLGTLTEGLITREGTTSTECTRYLPQGYSFVIDIGDDSGEGSAKAFTFTLDTPMNLTITHKPGKDFDSADEPFMQLIEGHHGHETPIGTRLYRAMNVHTPTVIPLQVGIALRPGAYTIQLANWQWQHGGAFTYRLTIDAAVPSPSADYSSPLVLAPGVFKSTYPENYTDPIGDYDIYTPGPDDVDVHWWLSGDDAASFTISSEGEVNFATQPDYETPTDYYADNIYNFTVYVSRGTSTGDLDVEITVTDYDEDWTSDEPGGL